MAECFSSFVGASHSFGPKDKEGGIRGEEGYGGEQDGLGAAVKAMAHLKATRLLPDEEAQLLEAACDALIFTLVPYITSCFTKVTSTSTRVRVCVFD